MPERRLFVAGSTGATGRTLLPLAQRRGVQLVPHVRPASAERLGAECPPGAAVLELDDSPALAQALSGQTTVVQLIGTMRKRFSSGDTYESSDIGTTRSLVRAAQGGTVDHIVLLSSVGAGKPRGAYLKAKAEAERLVTESGIDWTIFRPSAFVGEGHSVPWGVAGLTRGLGLHRYRPIPIEQLASAILHVACSQGPLGTVLEGTNLWSVVDDAAAAAS